MTFYARPEIELHRVRHPLTHDMGDPKNGAFIVQSQGLKILCSSGEGWEHVSVSRRSRCPSYEDMCWAKDRFWSEEDCCMQLHVPKAEHVNCHPNCLHLWRPLDTEIPRPPAIHVGPS